MRVRLCALIVTFAMLALLPGCGGDGQETQAETESSPKYDLSESQANTQKPGEEDRNAEERTVSEEPAASEQQTDAQAADESDPVFESVASNETTDTASTTADYVESAASVIEQSAEEEAQDNTMYLQIGNRTLTATLVENSSTAALKELLAQGPVTIDMRDYGSMEKVGPLGMTLPSNNQQMTTAPGDLILYQGNSFVIYYDSNAWSLTRLGKIDDVTPEELREILGGGDVAVTLSLNLQ